MLKPAHMQKVAVVGTKSERPRVVSTLYDMGAMQIEPLSKEAASVLKAEADVGGSKEVSEELLRIRALRAALPPTPVQGTRKVFAPSRTSSTRRGRSASTRRS